MKSTTAMTLFCLLSVYFGKSTAQDAAGKTEVVDLGVHFQKFGFIDVDKILADDSLLDTYIKCYLNKGPCNDLGAALKSE